MNKKYKGLDIELDYTNGGMGYILIKNDKYPFNVFALAVGKETLDNLKEWLNNNT